MNRKPPFEKGDFIGDVNDRSWRVDEVTETSYIVTDVFLKETKELLKADIENDSPSNYYGHAYYLERKHDSEDVKNFPIGSEWICTDESGLNSPKTDTVIIKYYGFSEGLFWVVNSKKERSIRFLANKEDLQKVE